MKQNIAQQLLRDYVQNTQSVVTLTFMPPTAQDSITDADKAHKIDLKIHVLLQPALNRSMRCYLCKLMNDT